MFYLRFKSDDATFGKHIGHIVKEKSISNCASAKATSKYDRAERKKVEYLYWVRILIFILKSTYETCSLHECIYF